MLLETGLKGARWMNHVIRIKYHRTWTASNGIQLCYREVTVKSTIEDVSDPGLLSCEELGITMASVSSRVLVDSVPSEKVVLDTELRKGFSKASLRRFTLTCPKPSRFWRQSDGAFAMSAKLCKVELRQWHHQINTWCTPMDVRKVSASILLILLMLREGSS